MEKLILILGMHRSGTSMVTGILNKMGLELGNDLMPPTTDNPKGYFENMDFFRVNEHFLIKNGLSWNKIGNIEKKPIITEENIQLLMRTIMKYKNHKVFGIKDPRICLLLPLYEQTCKELGIKIEYVYIERDKKSVINSIHKRDNLPKESVSKLIDGYLKYVMEKDFILQLKYENVLNDIDGSVKKIINSLPFLKKNDEIYKFIDKKLKRN